MLRTGVNVGVCGVLAFGLGADYVSTDDPGTITYALARPEPDSATLVPRTKEVPPAWHESLRHAFAAQDRIRELELSPLIESFVVPGSFDGHEASLSVTATDEGVRERLEPILDTVPLDLNVADEVPPAPATGTESPEPYQIAELDPDRIPGGVLCESDDSVGTLAPALFGAESGSRFFGTSNHLYGEGGTKETEHRGEPLSVVHDDESRRIGDVHRGYPLADLVVATPVDGYRPAAEIERAFPSRVIGQYTKAGLAELAARGEPLTKLGAMTDETSGRIEGIDGVTCFTGELCREGQLKWGDEESFTDGDSGSVNFHVDEERPEEYVLVGGMSNARTWWPGADFIWGTAGYHLLEEYGIHF
ncbi:hypothetical protein [Natronorarus salvus]|uniref:hypothetical protein n=1 Tax=Natronorarus salvus TaxID=3117733 RepID=UPI002F26B9D2